VKFHILFLLIPLHISFPVTGQGQFIQGQTYISYRAIDSLKIDGEADELSWSKAEWTNEFIDIEDANKSTPYLKTRVKMLWDDEYFYFYAKLAEPQIWANLKQRDTIIYWDNDFEIFIDPDGDTHNYYELEINALNTVWDLMLTKPYRDGGKAITSWDIPGLKTAVYVSGTLNNPTDIDNFWSIEVAIPWMPLKETLPKSERIINGSEMRINYSRVQWETEVVNGKYVKKKMQGARPQEKNWVWSPQRAIAMHEPEFWGRVYFSSILVGNTANISIDDSSEQIRQLLYSIHRSQRNRLKNRGSFSNKKEDCINSANLELVSNIEWTLDADKYWYHVKLNDPYDNGLIWHIDETGRLWHEKKTSNE